MEPSSSVGDEAADMEQTLRGPEQSIEEVQSKTSSEPLPNRRQCRICYAPEEASGADPILLLGCTCKGDISYGHQSCLKKWFLTRFQRNRKLDCEVCRNPLGARLKEIIQSLITAEVIQHAPQLLLLLQVPPHVLDHLQVPLETPDFYQLPWETRRSLEASFERLEQEQRRGQSRRREVFETARSIAAADREPSSEVDLQLYEDVDYLQLEDMLHTDFLELSEVNNNNTGLDHPPAGARVFTQHPNPRIDTMIYHSEDEAIGPFEFPEGRVLRVPLMGHEDVVHRSPVEDLLDAVSMQAARFVDLYGEDLILLPNFMDYLFLETADEPRLTFAGSEFHDNDDEVPIAIPALNPNSDSGADPVFAEAARQTDSIPRRVLTYGRFQIFQLLQ